MSNVGASGAATLPWLLKRAGALTWFELPRVLAVGVIWLASFGPMVAAAGSGGAWWSIAIGGLPAALLLTGLTRFAAIVARGDRPRVRDVFRVDPVLGLSIVAVCSVAGLLLGNGMTQSIGFIVAAVILLLLPYALAYGALRELGGLRTWRGALILVAYRPTWALTVLAFAFIGGFAIAATAGVLVVLVPGILAVFTSVLVGDMLDTIDRRPQ
jgi:hypothetical protein